MGAQEQVSGMVPAKEASLLAEVLQRAERREAEREAVRECLASWLSDEEDSSDFAEAIREAEDAQEERWLREDAEDAKPTRRGKPKSKKDNLPREGWTVGEVLVSDSRYEVRRTESGYRIASRVVGSPTREVREVPFGRFSPRDLLPPEKVRKNRPPTREARVHATCAKIRIEGRLPAEVRGHVPSYPREITVAVRAPRTRREYAIMRYSPTESARRHRDAILSLATGPIRRTCARVASTITSQTGSFTRAVSTDSLTSRERFAEDLRNARGPATHIRGSHSRAGQARQSRKAFGEDAEPPRHIERTPIREEGGEVLVALRGEDGSPKRALSDRGRIVGWRVEESPSESRRSLRVDIPSDCAEDVFAQVLARIASLRGVAIPCYGCPRRFPVARFLREAAQRDLSREQREVLADLRSRYDNGEVTEACPILWTRLGEKPPYRAGTSLPYGEEGDSVIAQHGRRRGERIHLLCRMKANATRYAWEAAFRYAFEAARRGTFADVRQDAEGEEIAGWEDTDLVFDEVFAYPSASLSDSPEAIVLDGIARGECLSSLVATLRESEAKATRGARLERVLRFAAEAGYWPSGAQVARALGIPERMAQRDLVRLRAFLSRVAR